MQCESFKNKYQTTKKVDPVSGGEYSDLFVFSDSCLRWMDGFATDTMTHIAIGCQICQSIGGVREFKGKEMGNAEVYME